MRCIFMYWFCVTKCTCAEVHSTCFRLFDFNCVHHPAMPCPYFIHFDTFARTHDPRIDNNRTRETNRCSIYFYTHQLLSSSSSNRHRRHHYLFDECLLNRKLRMHLHLRPPSAIRVRYPCPNLALLVQTEIRKIPCRSCAQLCNYWRTSRHFQLPVARMRILFIDSVVYSNSKIWKTNNLNRFEFDFVKRFISNRFIISFYVRHPRIDIWIIHERKGVLHTNNQILHFCPYVRCDCLTRSARQREITFRMRVIVLLIRVSIPLPPLQRSRINPYVDSVQCLTVSLIHFVPFIRSRNTSSTIHSIVNKILEKFFLHSGECIFAFSLVPHLCFLPESMRCTM